MNIISVYESLDNKRKESFKNSINSNLTVKENYDKNTYDDEWLTKMEETIRYLDNILRNPNRFIINEEEIVKIELARRITVDSIKHLSKNTNLIQEINNKTGEVRPSKILNINKEESFNTYENRFIYSLINNMKMYIERKKTESILGENIKDEKSFAYQGTSHVGQEQVEITLNMQSHLKDKGSIDGNKIIERINRVEEQIRDLCATDVYKNLVKLHVAPVISPIKKTNLILKNTNFQYALALWNYLQEHMESSSAHKKYNKNYQDNGKLKEMMDESFILNYSIMNTLNKETTPEVKKDLSEKVVSNMVGNLLNLEDVPLEDIMKLVGQEYFKVKYKKTASLDEIERAYKKAISDYNEKISNLKVEKDDK